MLDDGELSIVQALRRENMDLISKNRKFEAEILSLRVLIQLKKKFSNNLIF